MAGGRPLAANCLRAAGLSCQAAFCEGRQQARLPSSCPPGRGADMVTRGPHERPRKLDFHFPHWLERGAPHLPLSPRLACLAGSYLSEVRFSLVPNSRASASLAFQRRPEAACSVQCEKNRFRSRGAARRGPRTPFAMLLTGLAKRAFSSRMRQRDLRAAAAPRGGAAAPPGFIPAVPPICRYRPRCVKVTQASPLAGQPTAFSARARCPGRRPEQGLQTPLYLWGQCLRRTAAADGRRHRQGPSPRFAPLG